VLHSSDVHENMSKVTRRSFPTFRAAVPPARRERLAGETKYRQVGMMSFLTLFTWARLEEWYWGSL